MKNIKRLTLSLFAICGLTLPGFFTSVNAAGGYEASYISSVNKSSASIHGGDSIQLTVRSQAYDCGGQHSEYRTDPSRCSIATGSSPLVGLSLEVAVEMAGGTVSPSGTVMTDSSGYARFTLTSTTPGQKTVVIKGRPGAGYLTQVGTKTVTFTDSQPAGAGASASSNAGTSAGQPSASRTRQSQSAATQSSETAPAAPSVQEVKIGDASLAPDASDNALPTMQQGKSFKLSGKTTPNTEITVYVFSEPKMFKTKSDANGNWSVEVKGLPEGTHHAEFEATDPATGKPLPRVQLGYFKVQPSKVVEKTASSVAKTPATSNTSTVVAGAFVVAIIAAGAGYVVYRKRGKKPQKTFFDSK